MKLRHVLGIIFFLFSIIPLLFCGFFMMQENREKMISLMGDTLEAYSEMQIMSMQNFCESRRDNMQTIANYQLVKDAVLSELGKQQAEYNGKDYLDKLLKQKKEYSPFLQSISVLDITNHVVASSEVFDPEEESALAGVGDLYKDGTFHISQMYERADDAGTYSVVVAFCGIYNEEQLIGYVIEEIKTDYFPQVFVESDFWEHGKLYLIDGYQNVMAVVGNGEETKNPVSYSAKVANTDWRIRVTLDLRAYDENIRNYQVLLCLVIFSLMLVMLGVNVLITTRLTKPIEEMVAVLQEVQKEQDYSLRIGNHNHNEIGYLAKQVDELLDYIQKEQASEKARQSHLAKVAALDPLTGIRNKRSIQEESQSMIAKANKSGERVAIGFLDVDNFRNYNTQFGHDMGDKVIRFVAGTLADNIKGAVGRNGGDEFIFCMQDIESIEQMDTVLQNLEEKLNAGFWDAEKEVCTQVPCSIGVVISGGEKVNFHSLVKKADKAMYRAKENGKNTYHIDRL